MTGHLTRSLIRLLTVGLMCGGIVACASTKRADQNTRPFSADGISFAYPTIWRAHTYNEPHMTFSTTLVYLSSQALKDPCIVHHYPGHTITDCHQPLRQLQPGSILVTWSGNGSPLWTIREAQGTALGVDGHAGKLAITPDTCQISATEQMTAVIVNPGAPDNYYELDACIRAPHSARSERRIRTLLISVHIHS